jgi:site-specific DNA-methyltransferase (adenine-specific)
MSGPSHVVVVGDSRKMAEVADHSVHLVVTSPPYWQLKDYGHHAQIGFGDSYEDYINNLNLVWNECYRVLHPGCRLCVNVGDQFARSVYYGRYKVIPIRTEIIKFCETVGFDYMGAIIWQKVTTVHTTGGATIMGSFPYPRNGIVKIDYEFILLFRKLGTPPRVSRKQKEESKLTIEEWNEYFYGHWTFPGEKQDEHLAVFPEELPRRLIRMFSFVGETVLDPFLGSGTTTLAAMKLGRNSIGYEVNPDFVPLIRKKTAQQGLFERPVGLEIVRQEPGPTDFAALVETLPYVFRDPHKLDKKVDPRKLRFGSTIDGTEKGNESVYSVKRVLSPSTVELDTGVVVGLLGVTPIPTKEHDAVRLLEELTKGQRVFLRFDKRKYDEEDHLLAYLYLQNGTFVNKRLLARGVVAGHVRSLKRSPAREGTPFLPESMPRPEAR